LASLLWKSASSSRTSCGTTTSYRSTNVSQAPSSCRPMMGPASRIKQRGLLLLTGHRDGVEIARLELERDILRGQLGKVLIDAVGGQTRRQIGQAALQVRGAVSYTHLRAHETRHDLV